MAARAAMIPPHVWVSDCRLPSPLERTMRKCLILLIFVVLIRAGRAQDSTPSAARPSSGAVASYIGSAGTATTQTNSYASYGSTGYGAGSSLPPPPLNSKADHLQSAAMELYLAGLNEDAQKYRKMEAEERAHPTPPIVSKVCILELSRKKLGKLSSQPYGGDEKTSVLDLLAKLQNVRQETQHRGDPGFFRSEVIVANRFVAEERRIKVVSESKHQNLPGTVGCLMLPGGGGYHRIEGRPDGHLRFDDAFLKDLEEEILVDFVPQLLSGEQIRFDVRVRHNELDYEHASEGDPVVRYRNVETSVAIRHGQTIVFDCDIQRRFMAPNAQPVFSSGKAHRVNDEIRMLVELTADLAPQTPTNRAVDR